MPVGMAVGVVLMAGTGAGIRCRYTCLDVEDVGRADAVGEVLLQPVLEEAQVCEASVDE